MRKEDNIQAITQITPQQAKPYVKINDNQWNVYYYLLSISDYNSLRREDHRYVYRSEISPTKIAKAFGFTKKTYYNILEALQKKELIDNSNEDYILLPLPHLYTNIRKKLLSQLLAYRQILGIDFLRTYLIFKEVHRKYGNSKGMSIRNIVGCLGHSKTRDEYYLRVELYIDLLSKWDLIDYYTEWREDPNIGKYRVYKLKKVNDESYELNFRDLEPARLSGNGDFTESEEKIIEKALNKINNEVIL